MSNLKDNDVFGSNETLLEIVSWDKVFTIADNVSPVLIEDEKEDFTSADPEDFYQKLSGYSQAIDPSERSTIAPSSSKEIGRDSEAIDASSFKNRGFLLNESWDATLNIHSRVLNLTKDVVICECIVDHENKVFENRSFPRSLFENLNNLREKKLVLITIQTKPGSTRININNGEGMVNSADFSIEDQWKRLDNLGIDGPLVYD